MKCVLIIGTHDSIFLPVHESILWIEEAWEAQTAAYTRHSEDRHG